MSRMQAANRALGVAEGDDLERSVAIAKDNECEAFTPKGRDEAKLSELTHIQRRSSHLRGLRVRIRIDRKEIDTKSFCYLVLFIVWVICSIQSLFGIPG